MINKNKILVCPLDWGLGHASRMIPVIRLLVKYNFKVIIGADKAPLAMLRQEFPDLQWIRIPSVTIKYSKNNLLILKIMMLSPAIISGMIREHKILKKIIKDYDINLVISDNRYGLWNKKVRSVFVTHQVMVKMPKWLKFMEFPIHLIIRNIISGYDKCWIPDFEQGMKLAGDLSSKYRLPANAEYIGLLSRFANTHPDTNNDIDKDYYNDILVILSGPEPQRTKLENIIIRQLHGTNYKTLIIRGKPDNNDDRNITENIRLIPHASTPIMKNYILAAKYIVCRAGYSSIMDMITLGRKALLIPTPGQTEQEYLAQYLDKKELFPYTDQKGLDIEKDVTRLEKNTDPDIYSVNPDLLENKIKTL